MEDEQAGVGNESGGRDDLKTGAEVEKPGEQSLGRQVFDLVKDFAYQDEIDVGQFMEKLKRVDGDWGGDMEKFLAGQLVAQERILNDNSWESPVSLFAHVVGNSDALFFDKVNLTQEYQEEVAQEVAERARVQQGFPGVTEIELPEEIYRKIFRPRSVGYTASVTHGNPFDSVEMSYYVYSDGLTVEDRAETRVHEFMHAVHDVFNSYELGEFAGFESMVEGYPAFAQHKRELIGYLFSCAMSGRNRFGDVELENFVYEHAANEKMASKLGEYHEEIVGLMSADNFEDGFVGMLDCVEDIFAAVDYEDLLGKLRARVGVNESPGDGDGVADDHLARRSRPADQV